MALALLLFLGLAAAFAGAADQNEASIDVTLSTAKVDFAPGEAVGVTLTVTNTADYDVRILERYVSLREGELEVPIFKVLRVGKKRSKDASYIGKQVRFSPPTEDDFVVVEPGKAVTVFIPDLCLYYDCSVGGT